MGWFLFLAAIVLNVLAYFLLPKPKKEKPPEVKDGENPVADPSKPVPVVFGTMPIKELNVLWYGNKNRYTHEIDA